MPLRTLDDNVGLMHNRANSDLIPIKKPEFSHTKTGCRDSLSATGIIPLKAGWLVGMV